MSTSPLPPGGVLPPDPTACLLVADDAPINLLAIREFLEGMAVEIRCAHNGREAVAVFRQGGVDLVLLDIQMPELDGHGAAREMRRWEAENGWPPVPIIAVTAGFGDEEEGRALDAGCNELLAKPLQRLELREMVTEYLSLRPATPQLATTPRTTPHRVGHPPPSPQPLPAAQEEVLAHLRPRFHDQTAQDLEALERAATAGNWGEVARLAHACKGNALLFGHGALAREATALMQLVRQEVPIGVDQGVERLRQAFAAISLPPGEG